MADIFISYSNEDRPHTEAIARAFEERGWEVFWDRLIPVGESFHEVIETAIAESRCMVVLWSRHAATSNWVRNEAEEGERRGILAPAQLEQTAVPLGFRHLQTADLSDWSPGRSHQQFDELLTSIERILGAPPATRLSANEFPAKTRPRSRAKTVRFVLAILALTVLSVVGTNTWLKWDDARNAKQLLEMTRKSAENGSLDKQLMMGDWYSTGKLVAKNDAEAMKWYRMAAERGDAKGQYELAAGYAEGRGVAQVDTEAARWLRRAAEQGHASAQGKLGASYALGKGVEKDLAAAAHWFGKAAEQGDVGAQASLGFHYANGWGVPKDDELAVKWWRSAARQGDEIAKKQLRNNGLDW